MFFTIAIEQTNSFKYSKTKRELFTSRYSYLDSRSITFKVISEIITFLKMKLHKSKFTLVASKRLDISASG